MWLATVWPPAGLPPLADEVVAQLIVQLGHPDFTRRQAATQQLDCLGRVALSQLRGAARSEEPEVAHRANGLLRAIEWRVANETTLAPTRVKLTAQNMALDAVLASLSEQSGYTVVLWGPTADKVCRTRITVQKRSVPFWEALLAVCDAAELQIGAVAGFIAPGSPIVFPPEVNEYERRSPTPANSRPPPKPLARQAPDPSAAILLEPRTGKKRPVAVYGAMCVEAFPLPDGAAVSNTAAGILQVWAEPKLNWETTRSVRVDRATDTNRQHLAGVIPPTPPPPRVQAPTGRGVANRPVAPPVPEEENPFGPPPPVPAFTPNSRQTLAMFKPAARPSLALTEFTGSVRGVVRSGPHPLVVGTFDGDGQTTVEGSAPVSMRASVADEGGNWTVTVEVQYDPAWVEPASQFGGNKIDPTRVIVTASGLQVTDAAGRAFTAYAYPVPRARGPRPRPGPLTTLRLMLDLSPKVDGQGPPKTIAFWGTHAKLVELPFTLQDVPLAGGTR
jgi:hypothetical protein